MKRILAALLLAAAAGQARASEWQYVTYAAVAADVVTTRIALNQGFAEGNPILGRHPSNLVLGLSAGLRIGAAYLCRNDPTALKIMSAVTIGAVVNNAAALAGRKSPAADGMIGAGVVMLISIPF